jgi:hypothetical protein
MNPTLNSFLGADGRQSLEAAALSRAEQTWRVMAESASGPAQLARRWAELLMQADLADYLVETLKAGAERREWPSPLVGAVAVELGELDLSFPPPPECAAQFWGRPYTYGVRELLEIFVERCREMMNQMSSFNAVSATLSATISALHPTLAGAVQSVVPGSTAQAPQRGARGAPAELRGGTMVRPGAGARMGGYGDGTAMGGKAPARQPVRGRGRDNQAAQGPGRRGMPSPRQPGGGGLHGGGIGTERTARTETWRPQSSASPSPRSASRAPWAGAEGLHLGHPGRGPKGCDHRAPCVPLCGVRAGEGIS